MLLPGCDPGCCPSDSSTDWMAKQHSSSSTPSMDDSLLTTDADDREDWRDRELVAWRGETGGDWPQPRFGVLPR